ncbi:Glucose-6-phosphate isomerase, cytosolic [Tetrabaena socialis]|uniref:Glucose-6-phosphate isomerase n=1 Tax=Tetrabaena socialis TaxID=47790 RepID=A0A2J8AAG1_9CHLO|nr:Glucose-6-phosphate isomerase, cytosolic [Tetrabaena socialis]|eukprot:PNH09509.1 Glucose-6-phosphate isomerase, cytosolic [Tetrabaena socialis]
MQSLRLPGTSQHKGVAGGVFCSPKAQATAKKNQLVTELPAWQALKEHQLDIEKTHLRDLLHDDTRCMGLIKESEGIYCDFTRQRVTPKTLEVRGGGGHGCNAFSGTTEPNAMRASRDRRLRFLANVDPIDVARALDGLDPEETMVVVISKTFTTAETMLNARTVRSWLTERLGPEAVEKQMVAVSTNLKLVKEFGIDPENAFGFWDWVGGRYSVCSAVGILPLALQYGFDIMQEFLAGANNMDEHFKNQPYQDNLPVLIGLLSVWNVSFLGYSAKAILPYCQALSKLAPHIQQVDMESNGKGVDLNGKRLPFETGEIDFGETGRAPGSLEGGRVNKQGTAQANEGGTRRSPEGVVVHVRTSK